MDAQTWLAQFEYVARAAPRAGLPHMAMCFVCTPLDKGGPLPYAWAGAGLRDAWAGEHARMSGHRVERYEVGKDGGPHCLPPALPPRPRLGAAPAASQEGAQ